MEVLNIPLNKIKLQRNSRLTITKESLEGMMQSIKERGLLQPIGVVKNPKGGYEIAYGNRRFLAWSKLGKASTIPAVLRESKNESDTDLDNLTENIQRQNIGLVEAGRYMELLHKGDKDGNGAMKNNEIAVRLGVSRAYVTMCLQAYKDVPAKFQGDIEVQFSHNKKRTPGKIAASTATAIINAQKTYRLTATQAEPLFKAAKTRNEFSASSIPKYAQAIKRGAKGLDFLEKVEAVTHVRCQFYITTSHRDDLQKKYVDNGPFSSLNGLFCAVLEGKKSLKVQVKSSGR